MIFGKMPLCFHFVKNAFSQKSTSYRFFIFSNPHQGISGDDKNVNRTSGYFRPMFWFSEGAMNELGETKGKNYNAVRWELVSQQVWVC